MCRTDPAAAPALDGAAYVERQRGTLRLDGPLGGSAIGVLDGAGKPDERLGKSEARHDGEPKHLCSKSSALGHWNLSPVRRIPTPPIGWTCGISDREQGTRCRLAVKHTAERFSATCVEFRVGPSQERDRTLVHHASR